MWKNISINTQNIETETANATLINCPNNSEFKGYKFWHPSKLIRTGKNSYAISLGYTNEFKFKLKKYGNGKHNKMDVISEIEIGVEDFEEMFEVMNNNISTPKKETESYVITKDPVKKEEKVEIKECLKNK